MPSRVGITAQDVWQVALDGVPSYNLEGERLSDPIIEEFISAAENTVEAELDILIGTREIRCIEDQGDFDDDSEVDVIYRAPLDKPLNWFAGARSGRVKVPYRPIQKVKRLTVKFAGFGSRPIDIPLDRLRTHEDGFSLVPGANGYLFPSGANIFMAHQMNDGVALPGGVELVYTAGLGKRGLKQYPVVKTLILLQAAILSLTAVNVKLGGGVQKESLVADGLENTVDIQKGELGPLSGPLKALKSTHNHLMEVAKGQLRGITMVWLG